ncbi:MAG: hypothetical protein COA58_12960 [Bacteroidetes bacterium]|nr:MAG: hypothetical protein COA58_12960 [Bacteroidota bacterium]
MFPSLTGNGRIWIYVANRPVTELESSSIKSKLSEFCASWDAHGNRLTADFDIFHNQLFVLSVDEEVESASGCSIDKATAIFQQIDAELQLDLFNRMNLTFLHDNHVRIVRMTELNQAYHSGLIHDDMVFLDNTISKLSDLRARWQVPFKDSWAYRKVRSQAS